MEEASDREHEEQRMAEQERRRKDEQADEEDGHPSRMGRAAASARG